MSNSVIPWTAAHQAPLSLGILQARILEWVAFPLPEDPSQGIEPGSPALRVGSLATEPPGKPAYSVQIKTVQIDLQCKVSPSPSFEPQYTGSQVFIRGNHSFSLYKPTICFSGYIVSITCKNTTY